MRPRVEQRRGVAAARRPPQWSEACRPPAPRRAEQGAPRAVHVHPALCTL